MRLTYTGKEVKRMIEDWEVLHPDDVYLDGEGYKPDYNKFKTTVNRLANDDVVDITEPMYSDAVLSMRIMMPGMVEFCSFEDNSIILFKILTQMLFNLDHASGLDCMYQMAKYGAMAFWPINGSACYPAWS